MQIRTLAERLVRDVVLTRTLRVGGRDVPVLVSPDSRLRYLLPGRGAIDRDLVRVAETFVDAGSVVWDIGANVGTFTFAAAAVIGDGCVVAVEPDIWLAALLRRSSRLRRNADRDVRVLAAAVSACDSVAVFLIAQRGRQSNALEATGGRDQMGGHRERQLVPTLRLDTLLDELPAPDFVKIDIEGAEVEALRGGVRLVTEVRPTFYIEVGSTHADEVAQFFAEHGYVPFGHAGGKGSVEYNTFFVPSEREADHARRHARLTA